MLYSIVALGCCNSDVNVAELLGIRWAFDIFLSSDKFEGKELVIDSVSAAALA